MKKIDVCLSPELLNAYQLKGRIVVVVDIFRATSCMVTGFAHGVRSIIPVASLEECRFLQNQGYVGAAERDGKKADGFSMGNSPFEYMAEDLKGGVIVMTTTNGTQAINRARHAEQIIIGSFLNLTAVANYCKAATNDVLILCAGWKGKINAEDTFFAAALCSLLASDYEAESDLPWLLPTLPGITTEALITTLSKCNHAQRLDKLELEDDVKFCLAIDKYNLVPKLDGNRLMLSENTL